MIPRSNFNCMTATPWTAFPASDPLLTELFAAYRLLRIRHQILYANFKLGGDSLNFPRKQVSLLSGVSLICILLVFFAHFAVSISSVSRLLPPWPMFQTVTGWPSCAARRFTS